MIYVLYHSNCYDGFGAAYAAWKKLGNENVEYIPVSYGYPVPNLPMAEKVYIADFSFPAEDMEAIAENCSVVILDHHKTAKERLENWSHENAEVIFDMDRSGALITWEYFHGEGTAPDLIKHISDRDLWKFELDGTAKIHKALVSYPMDFKLWDSFDIEVLKKEGVTCERLYSKLVDNIVKSAWIKEIDGNQVPVVNTSIAWSEVGHALIEKYPDAPFVASFTNFENQVMWSLRSKEFDVSALAKKFGGGGHPNAAGFKTQRF